MAGSLITYMLKGRLTLSRSGWVLLEVPNSIGNGLFQALTEPGIEQPISTTLGRYNAHVSVIRPDEVAAVGGPDMIKSRGQTFGFNLGSVREIPNPNGWDEVSKCWVIEVRSPELMTLRRSLGLGDPKYPFHMTFAIRKKHALKAASLIHFQKVAATATAIRESPIEGRGLFATQNFKVGDVIVDKYMTRSAGKDDRPVFDQSEQCRFTNHSDQPNCIIELDGDTVKLVAARDIVRGEELTGDYGECTNILGNDFDFTYRGKPYDGSSSTESKARGDCCPVSATILRLLRQADADAEDPDDGHGRTAGDLDHSPREAGPAHRTHAVALAVAADNASAADSSAAEAGSARGSSQVAQCDAHGGGHVRRNLGEQVKHAAGVPQPDVWGVLAGGRRRTAGQRLLSAIGVDPANGNRRTEKSGAGRDRPADATGTHDAHRPRDGLANEFATGRRVAVNKNRADWDGRLKKLRKRRGECPGCGRTFKEDEPYPDVEMCEICERYGPPKEGELVKAGMSLINQIAQARKDTAPPASAAQAAAGNYAKGKFRMHGLLITIETPKGGVRSGTSKDGKAWSNTMTADYGYIDGTVGSDEDHVDVFVGPDPETEVVFVVDQIDPATGKFDEIKVMFGYKTEEAAREGYLSNYSKGWQGLKEITPLTMQQFKWWLENGDTLKAVAGAKIKVAVAGSIYGHALQQTPLAYNPQAGVLDNLASNLSAVKARGDRAIAEAGAQDRLANAADPNRASQRLLQLIQGGRQPMVQHPIDRILAGERTW